jgi:hypothetical protein
VPADVIASQSATRPPVKHSARGWIALVLAWPIFFFFWPVGIVASLFAIATLFKRSRRSGVIGIAGSPFVALPIIWFIWGIVSYFTGSAVLWSFGYPSGQFRNLDPELRCYRRTSGCVVTGSELFWQPPNNAGVRLMATWFGPVPGHYHGKYPSRQEARQLLETGGRNLTYEEFAREARSQKLKVNLEHWEPKPEANRPPPEFRIVEVENSSVLVGRRTSIVLFDRATGLKYATYRWDDTEDD